LLLLVAVTAGHGGFGRVLLHARRIREQALLHAEPSAAVCCCPEELLAWHMAVQLPHYTLPGLWCIT
jgi:hypothetical protein